MDYVSVLTLDFEPDTGSMLKSNWFAENERWNENLSGARAGWLLTCLGKETTEVVQGGTLKYLVSLSCIVHSYIE